MTRPVEVTVLAPDMNFAATLPGEEATSLICVGIIQNPFQDPHRVTVTSWIMGQR